MNTIKSTVKAVIFDMDGTIVDTERLGNIVIIELLKSYGFDNLTQDEEIFLETLTGMSFKRILNLMKTKFMLQDSVEIIANRISMLEDKLFLADNINFIDGFESFHNKLQTHKIPTSIATNADQPSLKRISQAMKLEQFFGPHMYSVTDVDHQAKPDPALFLHAAKKLNAQPFECIVFEDSIHGFKAAKAAGMRCIAIQNKYNQHFLDQVDAAIQSYHQAEDALKNIHSRIIS